jgi:hypothetical protein
MTTIVFRDGYLAADSRAYSGDREPMGLKSKLFDLPDGGAVGISTSHVGFSERFAKWLRDGADEKDFPFSGEPSLTALMINGAGEVFYFKDSPYPTGPLKAAFFAIGTGSDYAMGAMEQGASAIDAIHVAKKLDVWTGGDVLVKDLRTRLQRKLTDVLHASESKKQPSAPNVLPLPRGEAL